MWMAWMATATARAGAWAAPREYLARSESGSRIKRLRRRSSENQTLRSLKTLAATQESQCEAMPQYQSEDNGSPAGRFS